MKREMKTAMQEHIKWLKIERGRLESAGELGIALHIGDCIEHAESILEKEKEVMCEFTLSYFIDNTEGETIEDFFDETFKTKEK